MLDLMWKDFKAIIINIFTELKKSIIKEVKKGHMTMLHKIENITKWNFEEEPSGNSGVKTKITATTTTTN